MEIKIVRERLFTRTPHTQEMLRERKEREKKKHTMDDIHNVLTFSQRFGTIYDVCINFIADCQFTSMFSLE